MTRKIELTQGKFALVDNDMYEELSKINWRYHNGYAVNNLVGQMHKIMDRTKNGMETDHKNEDTLDNRRENLRDATHSQNMANQKKQSNTSSRFKGVSFHYSTSGYKKWQAVIRFHGKNIHLGYFYSEEEATRVYDSKAKELFGEFARINMESS